MTGDDGRGERIAVIGGGPAGLMAAERLSEAGQSVTVIERMPTVGRKLLMAGRGGLNLTHGEPLDRLLDRFAEARPRLEPAIRRFDNKVLTQWCEGLGQPTFIGSSGRVFPKALKASPLLRAWLARLRERGVDIVTRTAWAGFAEDGGLRLSGPDGTSEVMRPRATILALGGASWPRLGADGGWVRHLRGQAVSVRDLVAANAGIGIAWSPEFALRFAGTALKTVEIGWRAQRYRGDLVVTAYGLEGGAAYRLGPSLRQALAAGEEIELKLDLKPDTDAAKLADRLAKALAKGRSSSNALRQAGLAPVASALLREAGLHEAGLREAAGGLPREPAELARLIKALPFRVRGLEGLERAISSAGGVAWAELDDAFMLRRLPGVFACGEMLDWEAPTGGYLLQACCATGRAAAEGALAWLSRSG